VHSFSIPRRFSGPPDSGNGGYTCGLFSNALNTSSLEVTLRKPIPLETPLHVIAKESATDKVIAQLMAELSGAPVLIAEAAPVDLYSIAAPISISHAEAEQAEQHSPAFHRHPFPTCFVCGPERAPGDGLRIFPGPLDPRIDSGLNPALAASAHQAIFASAWTPAAEFAAPDGNIRNEFIWAALDCPTGFAAGFPSMGRLVTGRLAAEMVAPVRASEPCIILSWPLGIEGRKNHAAAALLGEDGSLRARARATWIKLD